MKNYIFASVCAMIYLLLAIFSNNFDVNIVLCNIWAAVTIILYEIKKVKV
jgi:hypothetical protein